MLERPLYGSCLHDMFCHLKRLDDFRENSLNTLELIIRSNNMRKILSTTLTMAMAFAISGCVTYDPYSDEKKTSNATIGAVAGVITGAAIGAATAGSGNKDRAILTGALAGGVVGGGAGYYMDRQEAELRRTLKGTGVRVKRNGDNIQLIMPGNITFSSGRSDIRSDFHSVLNSVAVVLAEFKKTRINVTGHTDNTGGADLNQRLSEQRAGSVKSYLIGRRVPSGRVNSVGYGFRYPITSNNTAGGREQNRRVELDLEPTE